MKSFQELYTELQDQTGDSSTAMLARFKRWINDTQDIVLADYPWKFLERDLNITTVASTARYELGASVRKLVNVITTPDSGTTIYTPEPVEDPDFWNHLQSLDSGKSDVPEYYFQDGNDLLLWPKYSTAGHTITTRARINPVHMTLADYTTGTITSITSGAKALVGASTVWTGRSPVREQWLKIDPTDGDGRWYRVSAIGSDTTITFEKAYLGATISAATASYTLGEFSLIPANHHSILLTRPMALYYEHIENGVMANRYWKRYDGGMEIGLRDTPGGMLKKFINEQSGMLDSSYYAPRTKETRSREQISKDNTLIFG